MVAPRVRLVACIGIAIAVATCAVTFASAGDAVKGVAYSPVPIGENPISAPPYGDYFTSNYAALWARDLPLIAALGANTVRIYGWQIDADHTSFLDALQSHGLRVLIGYFMGTSAMTPLATPEQRNGAVARFRSAVARTAAHSAVLGWSFGNEMNGVWLGFVQQFNANGACGWNAEACYGRSASECDGPTACVYTGLFTFLESAAAAGKAEAPHQLFTTSFADVDLLPLRIGAFGGLAPSMSVWGAQIYRGRTFGSFFAEYAAAGSRPLLITEYGVDSYDDSACANDNNCGAGRDDGRVQSGAGLQAEWDAALTQEILSQPSSLVMGGCVMEWSDEYWKNADTNVKRCNGGECEWHAHVSCPRDPRDTDHAVCGYPLQSSYDGYSNEAWFGVVNVVPNGGGVDGVEPRPVYYVLQKLWGGGGGAVLAASPPAAALLLPGETEPVHWSVYAWFVAFTLVVIRLTVLQPLSPRLASANFIAATAPQQPGVKVLGDDGLTTAPATEHTHLLAKI